MYKNFHIGYSVDDLSKSLLNKFQSDKNFIYLVISPASK